MHVNSWKFVGFAAFRRHVVGLALIPASVLLTAGLTADAAQPHEDPEASDYSLAIADWRAEREEELKGPEGWLNLAGLYWLEPGATSMGTAPDNDIVLAGLPAAPYLGELCMGERDR